MICSRFDLYLYQSNMLLLYLDLTSGYNIKTEHILWCISIYLIKVEQTKTWKINEYTSIELSEDILQPIVLYRITSHTFQRVLVSGSAKHQVILSQCYGEGSSKHFYALTWYVFNPSQEHLGVMYCCYQSTAVDSHYTYYLLQIHTKTWTTGFMSRP